MVAALQQLQGQLNKNGLASLAGRVTNVQSLLLGPVVARALQIRSAVLQRRRPRTENAIRTNAKTLAKEVSSFFWVSITAICLISLLNLQCVEMLAQSSSPDAIEFCNLQSTYEMEGLLEAHDLIATGTDRVPGPTIFVPNDGAEMASNQNIANNNILNVNIPVKLRSSARGIRRINATCVRSVFLPE